MVRPRRTGSHIGSPGEQLLVRGALQATFMESLGLDPPILDAVRALGIDEFTEPQVRAIPRILAGANVLLVAPTGIGKTEAAFLPILQHLLREKPAPTSGLYITPLRALNRDMLRRMTFFAERLGVRVAVRHGDTTPQERAAMTRHPPDVLITTPETFQILFTGRRLREHLRSVRWVVIDEIHELASDERGAQLAVGLERLRDLTGREFQRIGLSATVGTPDEVGAFLAGVDRPVEVIRVRMPKGMRIRVEMPEPGKEDAEIADRLRVQAGQATALRRCYEQIKEHQSTLVFVDTRDTAEFLSSRLAAWYQDPGIGVHHGSLSKDVRVQMEDEFKAGRLRALVCTSSLELGIDVGGADFVLQYNSPREVSRLVQRIGRDGKQLASLQVFWTRDGRLGRSSNSLPYFCENISMIPDVKTYRVVVISSRRAIGTLDEWFVAENATLGESFIMRGAAWRFVEFKEDHILVEPVREIGDVPSWVGEDIPVPFAVAQEVGRLRRERDLAAYPVNGRGAAKFLEYLASVGDAPLGTDKRITIETARDVIIVNACLGSKVNETLAQLISSLVSARFGQSVGLQTDPYRIVLEVPRSVNPQQIVEILRPEDPDALEPLLRVILKNSAFLRWAFVYVAKKFGALRRDVDWESVSIPRLLKTFENTPLFEEVLDKVFWERMDIPRTVDVLRKIRAGEIEVVVTRMTPVGRAGLEGGRLLVTPSKADHATLMAVKARLEEESAIFLCPNCKMSCRGTVRDLPAKIRCPRCEALMVAVIAPYEKDKVAKLDFGGTDKESRSKAKRLFTNASLVMAHGKKTVVALMARGVGEDTAARILRGYHETEEDFLRDLLAAEVTYARTKRFWD